MTSFMNDPVTPIIERQNILIEWTLVRKTVKEKLNDDDDDDRLKGEEEGKNSWLHKLSRHLLPSWLVVLYLVITMEEKTLRKI